MLLSPFCLKTDTSYIQVLLALFRGKNIGLLELLQTLSHYCVSFDLTWMNLIFSLSVMFSSPVSVHCICISFSHAHSFHSLVSVYFVWECQSKNTPKTPYTQTLDFSWAASQRAFHWVRMRAGLQGEAALEQPAWGLQGLLRPFWCESLSLEEKQWTNSR